MEKSIGTVTALKLTLRARPSTKSETLAMLNKDETLEIRGKEGDWFLVSNGKQEGFVHSRYVSQQTTRQAEERPERELLAERGETSIFIQLTSSPWALPVEAFTLPVGVGASLGGGQANKLREALGPEIWSSLEHVIENAVKGLKKPFDPGNPVVIETPDDIREGAALPRWLFLATAFGPEPKAENSGIAALAIANRASGIKIPRLAISFLGSGKGGLSPVEVFRNMFTSLAGSAPFAGVKEVTLTTLSKMAFDAALEYTEESREFPKEQKLTEEEWTGYRPGLVPLHMDEPALEDLLGRKPFARALAKRLRRISKETAKGGVDSAFMVHIHAPWGAGKTTVLNFLGDALRGRDDNGKTTVLKCLRDALRRRDDDKEKPWVVVEFNAWQNQHLEPPWWTMLDSIFRQAVAQLFCLHHPRFFWLWLREHLWRLTIGRAHVFFAIAVAFWLLFAFEPWHFFFSGQPSIKEWIKHLGEISKWLSAILGLAATIWSGLLVLSRSLFSASGKAAQDFMQWGYNPMRRISEHTKTILKWINRPVAVLVDDVDRCSDKYVVFLLEGIQTLFRNPRLMFVLAGDRRWLNVCFENTYERFSSSVKEPGRRLGTLFLEKAFQLSVALPLMSDGQREDYWNRLLRTSGPVKREEIDKVREEAQKTFAKAKAENDIMATLRDVSTSGVSEQPLFRQQVFREEAVVRMAAQDIQETTEHFLRDFSPLLEANPRSLKRLVNTYGIYRDIAILSDIDVESSDDKRKQLALYTIVSLRWPILAEILSVKPELATNLTNKRAKVVPKELVAVFSQEDIANVRRVFNGEVVTVKLNKEAVANFARMAPAGPGTSPI